ncbi:MAG: RNA methyltransferase [Bacteroidia bacterium]|nr:RNA methyltransferase [Bacteroidia bacterium]MCX7764051.1 RNA methyltransferase [Bacteroidia bacterium]MDW8057080.1 RNA methyltransferase [Bacteroidia bacterium]
MPRLPHPPEFYRRLHESKHRWESGLFLAPGKKLLEEALRSYPPHRFHAVFYERTIPLPPLPPELHQKTYALPPWQIKQISGQESPEGIVTVLKLPAPHGFPPYPPAVLVERLQDPGNVGALLRAMEWFGYHHLWLTMDSADPFAPKAVRASMGSLFRLHAQRVERWESLLAGYEGRCVVASTTGIPVYEIDWLQYDSLYIGSESHGVQRAPAHWPRVVIPPEPSSQAESLNAAMAATILLYIQREVRAGRLHTLPPQ